MANKLQTALEKTPAWRDAFKASSIKAGFHIGLSRAMVEFLSAVADDVTWDRAKWGGASPFPDNFIATAASLIKRGLIVEKTEAEKRKNIHLPDDRAYQWSNFQLSEAGFYVVKLLKIAGFFVEADAAIEKRARS